VIKVCLETGIVKATTAAGQLLF